MLDQFLKYSSMNGKLESHRDNNEAIVRFCWESKVKPTFTIHVKTSSNQVQYVSSELFQSCGKCQPSIGLALAKDYTPEVKPTGLKTEETLKTSLKILKVMKVMRILQISPEGLPILPPQLHCQVLLRLHKIA